MSGRYMLAVGRLKGANSRKRYRETWKQALPDFIRPPERLAVPLPPRPSLPPLGWRFEDLVAAFGLGVALTALAFIVIGWIR